MCDGHAFIDIANLKTVWVADICQMHGKLTTKLDETHRQAKGALDIGNAGELLLLLVYADMKVPSSMGENTSLQQSLSVLPCQLGPWLCEAESAA